ncbi:MAG: nucleotidyltransferase substrate binding protein [Magnetococcales bacterium]|nr:nucleotidyltransferase substrate binding protein [Magnetococcales bacterium]
MGLDLTSFVRAIERLAEGEAVLRERPAGSIVQDGVIQRFEFTYELACKTLRYDLKMTLAVPNALYSNRSGQRLTPHEFQS